MGTLQGHSLKVVSLAISPNGKLLASCSLDKLIFIWSLEQKIKLFELEGHSLAVRDLCFSPDGL